MGTGAFHTSSQPCIISRTSQSVPASSASLGLVDMAVLQLPLLSQPPLASQPPSVSQPPVALQPPSALQPLISQVASAASGISSIYDDELASHTLGCNEDDVRMVHGYLLFMFFSQLLQNTSVTPNQSISHKCTCAPSESPSPPSSQPQGHRPILYTPPWVPCRSAQTTRTPYRSTRIHTDSIWIRMDPRGIHVTPSESVWILVTPCGSTWIPSYSMQNPSQSAQNITKIYNVHNKN
jgi:hypothetical protein